ncbi:YwqG family protein [Actinoplanes sp. M2I2]|uniref:YwqG family protein n=1 Tax=Actinoplanes sp. M2I2 TaxID=1734444 RepID=UPI0020215975|nr:YwqG family protein [Actinoplanes sp. M2I2]
MDSTANAAELIEAARATLPPAVADAWIGLMRPAVRLRRAAAGEPVAGQLGGSPALPENVEWPRSEAGRPLGFVAGIDLGRVPAGLLDMPLPVGGMLLLFYRDPAEDPHETFWISDPVPVDEPPTGRVVFVPAGTATTVRSEPGAAVYPEVPLAVEVTATGPDWEHPALRQAVEELSDADKEFMADAFNSDEFGDEVSMRTEMPRHYLGGYAYPVQDSVEVAAAWQRLGSDVSYSDPALWDEARLWTSLVQIDSDDDAEMMWGDCGSLYWVIRRDDLAVGRFEAATFLFQCS